MSQLNRTKFIISESPKRYLSEFNLPTAKRQAYLLRDLIEQHCGTRLKGGDVTDCLAILFHGQDWSTLTANLREASQGDYYALNPQTAAVKANQLRRLIPGLSGNPIRAILDMPNACYTQSRTIDGARLATLISGQPAWEFVDQSFFYNTKIDVATVFDGRTDKEYLPRHFSSDPMTNEERLHAIEPVSGETIDIPIDQVRFTRFTRPQNEEKVDYVLVEHAPCNEIAQSFYKNALNYTLARRWFNAGNEVCVTIFQGDKIIRHQLSDSLTGKKRDFDKAMQNLKKSHMIANAIMTASGIDEVRDPIERWFPSFKHTKAILPKVEIADAAYCEAIDQLSEAPAEEINKLIREATRSYNEVLINAVDSFWRDTREINSRSNIELLLRTSNMDERLCFGEFGPLAVLKKMIGLGHHCNPCKK